MSQNETKPWVIITVFKDEVNPSDIERIAPQIQSLTGGWAWVIQKCGAEIGRAHV